MVVMEGLYREEDLPVLNVFFYTKFAPDLQIGHVMDPAKLGLAFRFLSRSLTLLRRSEGMVSRAFVGLNIYLLDILMRSQFIAIFFFIWRIFKVP